MSKKVIRLTESELKRMIKSIISEQSVTPGAAAAPAQGIKKELLAGLNGVIIFVNIIRHTATCNPLVLNVRFL